MYSVVTDYMLDGLESHGAIVGDSGTLALRIITPNEF